MHEKVKTSIFPVLDLMVDELELAELEGFKVNLHSMSVALELS